MLSVIIHDNGEPNVTKYTYETLYKELKDIQGSELIIAPNWLAALPQVKNSYVCFVEADCLVSPGFFRKQLDGLLKSSLRRIAMMSPVVAVERWDNRFYGYQVGGAFTECVLPVTKKKSTVLYPIQIGFIPGSVIRVKMLRDAITTMDVNKSYENDLVFMSAILSLAFWQQGNDGDTKNTRNGNQVYLNPGVTYVTTEDYVNDIGNFDMDIMGLLSKFNRESI